MSVRSTISLTRFEGGLLNGDVLFSVDDKTGAIGVISGSDSDSGGRNEHCLKHMLGRV